MPSRTKSAPAPALSPGEQAKAVAVYDVTLNGRFKHEGFDYLPGHTHHVDHAILTAMKAEGVVDNVVQLS